MNKKAYLTAPSWRFGSFDRKDFEGSLMQRKFNLHSFFIALSKKKCVFEDRLVLSFINAGLVKKELYEAYVEEVKSIIPGCPEMERGTNEDLFKKLHKIRLYYFGADIFHTSFKQAENVPEAPDGINQARLCGEIARRRNVLFYLSSPIEIPQFLQSVKEAEASEKNIFCLEFDRSDGILPDKNDFKRILGDLSDKIEFLKMPEALGCLDFSLIPYNETLAKAAENNDLYFAGFGEDALLCCRNLNIPAIVYVKPRSLPVRAVTGLFTEDRRCLIAVPARFDIIPFVPMIKRTKMSYYQLAILEEKYGSSVYNSSFEELAKRDPEIFFNIYDDHLPPVIHNNFKWESGDFDKAREEYFVKNLNLPGTKYLHKCFSKDTFEPKEVDWNENKPQKQVIVDGVIADPDTKVIIYPGDSGSVSPRKMFFETHEKGSSYISNFSFFFTKKLTLSYNSLLKGREKEKLPGSLGYIDYKRYRDDNGVLHETFPLYNKSCLAAKAGGGYMAFSFALSGGSVTLFDDLKFTWQSADVNPENMGEICVLTPELAKDIDADPVDFTLPVGEGRLNVVIINEEIICIRKGDVCLPCIGVVLSLGGGAAKRLLKRLGDADKDGYYEIPDKNLKIKISAPAGFDEKDWEALDWIYGGGIGLLGPDFEITADSVESIMQKEGWLNPLSRQTQETDQHVLSLQPRTAAGVTKSGGLFVLVFSGRANVSEGADYSEMCRIAKRLVPDIEFMINWDGGGSSVLGLLEDNVFTEISLPGLSDESLVGMTRPINSMIRIIAKEKK